MPRQPILSVLGHVDSGKCVAPDTEIQLYDGSTVSAEKLFEDYKNQGTRLEDQEGEVYSLEDSPELVGVEEGKVVACDAEKIWKLEKDKLLEFDLADGSNVQVTPEHPFLIVEEFELKFKPAEELESSDMVAVPETLLKEEKNLQDLKEETLKKLSENKRILCFTEQNFSKKLELEGKDDEDSLLTNRLSSCRRNGRFRAQDLVRICEESDIELDKAYDRILCIKQATLKHRAGSTSKRIELPSTSREFEDLAYAVGMMLGDGDRSARKLYNNSETLRNRFKTRIENSVGVETEVNVYEEQVDEVNIRCGKTLSKFFEIMFDFPVERKSHSITLSSYAQKLPKSILSNLLTGYFDADGYVNKKGGVEVTSASKEMIDSVKTALKQFGISAYISKDNEYYTAHITGRENLEQFTQIGFKHPEKQERFLKHLEKSKKNPVTGTTPVAGQKIKEARLEIGASHTEMDIPYQKRYEQYEHVSKSYLKKFTQKTLDLLQNPEFKLNKKEKTNIVEKLSQKPQTRTQIYEETNIDHPRLLNHLISLESQELIDRSGDKIQITENGKKLLETWKNNSTEKIEKLDKIASSDLKFIEVDQIEEKEGGTVYDFSTEAETFIAEDIIVHNTTILDAIRESKIVEGEAGGITQMIGATEIPIDSVETVCGDLLQQLDTELTIPGLLFIDTPGHAAFSSLRKRGGSISDIAILVIDIEEGVQPQTEEAIKILKQSQTPFVIALNKVDKLPGWKSEDKCFSKNIRHQNERIVQKLDEEIYELMADLNEYGFVIDRFDRVDNFTEKIGVIPTSAKTGEGLPELLMVVSGLAQNYLGDKLEVEEGIGKATVLEVSEQKGFGTTVDVIHYDGTIKKSDKLVYGTADGVKVTDIRALLEPRPLKEIRLDKQYEEVESVQPASGIKIAGKDLEGIVSGAPIRTGENIEEMKSEVEKELETTEYDTQNSGVIVKADSLGSLEALMREIQDIELDVQKAEVGLIKKSEIIEVENEEPEERAILAFNSGMTENAEELAESKNIEVFSSNVIYEILENYTHWRDEMKEGMREKALEKVSRPAEIRTLQDHVFRSSNPVVVGMKVVDGVVNHGSVMDESGEKIGRIKSLQDDGESLEKAEKGDMVALSIANASLERDFEAGDHLFVDVTSKDYKRLQELEDLLSEGEKNTLEKIVEIKDSVNPHWKLG